MTHVVTDACINCKYTECVIVCPVNCFKEGPNMLVIDPDVCIDCGVCVPECPANAIKSDTQAGCQKWVALNRELSQTWPTIQDPKDPPHDADLWKNRSDKLQYLHKSSPHKK